MKRAQLILIVLLAMTVAACRKINTIQPTVIDLGVKSQSTGIKKITETNNIVTAEFQTTPGAKYTVLVIPFGKDESVMKDGFTAQDTVTSKQYDLRQYPKRDYDLVFMDISGKDIKYPITIK